MTASVYDFSFSHDSETPDKLLAAGAVGALGYVGSDRAKCLTLPNVDALHGAGLPVATIHENTTDWRSWDADAANRAADALGQPGDRPIIYAVDNQVPTSEYRQIADFLMSRPGRPKGIYGGKGLIHACLAAGAVVGMATNATSFDNGDHDQAGIALQQLYNLSTIPGTDRDLVLLPDWGQWPYDATKPPEVEVGKVGNMLAAPKVYEDTYPDPALRGQPYPPGQRGEIVYCEEGSKLASHITTTGMVALYQGFGVGGPVPVSAEWFEDLTILPAGHLAIPV